MEINLKDMTITFGKTTEDIYMLAKKLASKNIAQVAELLNETNQGLPRVFRTRALRMVLNEFVMIAKELPITTELLHRLNWYTEYSDYQLTKLFTTLANSGDTKFHENACAEKYKISFWILILVNASNLKLNEDTIEKLTKLDDGFFPFVEFNNQLNNCLYDFENCLDVVPESDFNRVMFKSSTVAELRDLADKYEINVPKRLNRAQLLEVIIQRLEEDGKFDDAVHAKIKDMKVVSLQRFAKDNDIKASTELRKDAVIDFILKAVENNQSSRRVLPKIDLIVLDEEKFEMKPEYIREIDSRYFYEFDEDGEIVSMSDVEDLKAKIEELRQEQEAEQARLAQLRKEAEEAEEINEELLNNAEEFETREDMYTQRMKELEQQIAILTGNTDNVTQEELEAQEQRLKQLFDERIQAMLENVSNEETVVTTVEEVLIEEEPQAIVEDNEEALVEVSNEEPQYIVEDENEEEVLTEATNDEPQYMVEETEEIVTEEVVTEEVFYDTSEIDQALAQKEAELAAREAELEQREASADELAQKEAELAAREEELARREAAADELLQKQKELNEKEEELARELEEARAQGIDREAELAQRQEELDEELRALREAQAELDALEQYEVVTTTEEVIIEEYIEETPAVLNVEEETELILEDEEEPQYIVEDEEDLLIEEEPVIEEEAEEIVTEEVVTEEVYYDTSDIDAAIAAKEALLAEKEAELAAKENNLYASATQINRKQEELDAKEQELAQKEDEVNNALLNELALREAELAQREIELAQELEEARAQGIDREDELAQRQAELEREIQELKQAQAEQYEIVEQVVVEEYIEEQVIEDDMDALVQQINQTVEESVQQEVETIVLDDEGEQMSFDYLVDDEEDYETVVTTVETIETVETEVVSDDLLEEAFEQSLTSQVEQVVTEEVVETTVVEEEVEELDERQQRFNLLDEKINALLPQPEGQEFDEDDEALEELYDTEEYEDEVLVEETVQTIEETTTTTLVYTDPAIESAIQQEVVRTTIPAEDSGYIMLSTKQQKAKAEIEKLQRKKAKLQRYKTMKDSALVRQYNNRRRLKFLGLVLFLLLAILIYCAVIFVGFTGAVPGFSIDPNTGFGLGNKQVFEKVLFGHYDTVLKFFTDICTSIFK